MDHNPLPTPVLSQISFMKNDLSFWVRYQKLRFEMKLVHRIGNNCHGGRRFLALHWFKAKNVRNSELIVQQRLGTFATVRIGDTIFAWSPKEIEHDATPW